MKNNKKQLSKDRRTHLGAVAKTSPLSITLAVTALFTLTVIAARPSHADSYDFRVVAQLGDPAPGGGDHEGDFEPQDINDSGTVMFVSDLSTGGEGLFRSRHGVNTQIVRSGLPAPGTSANFGPFGILTPGGMNNAGNMAFGFTLDVPFTEFGTNAGVWRYDASHGTVTKVLVPGDPAPGGTTFRGTIYHTDINNHGVIATVGIIDTPDGNCQDPLSSCFGLGRGIYTADNHNVIRKIMAPGDQAPGSISSKFDDAWDPSINDGGDIVFGAHVLGEECIGGTDSTIGCFESLYRYRSSNGRISSVAHQGGPAPGGGNFRIAFNGQINNRGDIAYIGDLAVAPAFDSILGVFLADRAGVSRAVARPGDSLPGGTMMQTTFNQGSVAINNSGVVAFVAKLDADVNGDGIKDTGVYVNNGRTITTVVRTGTEIPGLGTVKLTNNPIFVSGSDFPWPGIRINDHGEVLTQVILENGDTYVIVASPHGSEL
jgi:hypothetical protein